MKTRFLCALLCAHFARALSAQEALDRLDRSLTTSLFQDQLRARLSGFLDLEYYNYPQPPPGLIRADDGHNLFAPRLSAFLDVQAGSHVYFFAQARADTGFDPSDLGKHVRLDEYALRVTPWRDGRFNLQVGKFSTVVGNWVARHLSWDNPFVNAPVPYENPVLVSDREVPVTGQSFRAVPGFDKYEFLPIIWGPAYTLGASVAGQIGIFEYAAEIKNAVVASRPEIWDNYDFEHPAFGVRVGLRPDEAWRLGISFADGPYLQPTAEPLLDGGEASDFRQFVLGQDLSYARGHFQVWAEAFEARFQLPRLGNADVFAYYLEAKYKFTPQLFGALRWNQEFFITGRDIFGERVARLDDVWRVDAAVGYRFTEHLQLKLQYSVARGDFVSKRVGSTFAAQFTVRY